jgi:isocitrate dehydrogenase (NAD+)
MIPRIVFIQGGGIGIDQEAALRRIFDAAGVEIDWQRFEAGLAALEKGLEPMPRAMLDAVRETGVALKTKLLNPPGDAYPNFNVQLRQELGLFASVRPLQNLEGLPARFRGVNILLVREITEDLYNASEHEIVPGVVQSIKVVTEAACRRFFRFAFELARKHGRKSIHCIHKANILKLADGLFLHVFRQIARDFPDIQPLEMIVDNACMQLVSRPGKFEVMAAGNLYGDLLSDLGAGLVGGISAAPGINHGEGIRVYEAIHGADRSAVGMDRANPLPLVIPALHLLRDFGGEESAASRIQRAVETVLTEGRVKTFDLGGTASTMQMADAIAKALQRIAD